MNVELVPIREFLPDNTEFVNHADCLEALEMSVMFYAKIGYRVPWIGYFVRLDGHFVGSAGYKGKPVNNQVEIAYGTFTSHQHKGIGNLICRALVTLARATDPAVRVMARTLREENYSVRILRKNGFKQNGVVFDPDDGKVWEWEYRD